MLKNSRFVSSNQWRTHGGFRVKKKKSFLFGTICFFFFIQIVFLGSIQLAYIISRNFHYDAIIPVVQLFWCAALEAMADSKCKPGQGQWALLKLESCCDCDVIKRLFSTTMAGQDNVSAQNASLEENGCNAGRCSARDDIILS